MEALWTRFYSLTLRFGELLYKDKAIGKDIRAYSDLAFAFSRERNPYLFNADLAGGAPLNVGVYAFSWLSLIACHHPDNNKEYPSLILSAMMKTIDTGVDKNMSFTMMWDKPRIMTVGTCGIGIATPPDVTVRFQGELGDLIIPVSSAPQVARQGRRSL
ncbi:hypothetical protein V1512DRAFT_266939 [Lipomyces arxii]|uniref:uncharacterized protein n=1 Tax=Lipomyces arxii TaxID=56418 RepID=UPI0034CFAB84